MKPHIVIPLLVVCVAMPLVAIGTFYLCDSMPFIEEARAREKNYPEEKRLEAEAERSRLAALKAERGRIPEDEHQEVGEEEKPQTKLAETTKEAKRDAEPVARRTDVSTTKKGEKVAIGGISINLPLEQLKQELAAKYGGIKGSNLVFTSDVFDDLRPRMTIIGDPVRSLDHHLTMNSLDKRSGPEKRFAECQIYFPNLSPHLFEVVRKNDGSYDWSDDKAKGYEYKGRTPFAGKVTLYTCGTDYFVVVSGFFSDEGGSAEKYEAALQDKYGDRDTTNGYRIMDDGIIVTKRDNNKYTGKWLFCYFNKSVRDGYFKNKAANEKEEKEREERKEKERKEKEEKRKARDAEGI
ncbi:MAG: hypothetical protein J6333_11475 [Planctomycetes bacterium]|nr:hypothetical protein [Planctomycetota bacterium]